MKTSRNDSPFSPPPPFSSFPLSVHFFPAPSQCASEVNLKILKPMEKEPIHQPQDPFLSVRFKSLQPPFHDLSRPVNFHSTRLTFVLVILLHTSHRNSLPRHLILKISLNATKALPFTSPLHPGLELLILLPPSFNQFRSKYSFIGAPALAQLNAQAECRCEETISCRSLEN